MSGVVPLAALPQPTIGKKLLGVFKVASVVRGDLTNPNYCGALWHCVASEHNIVLKKQVNNDYQRICRLQSIDGLSQIVKEATAGSQFGTL